MNQNDSTKEQSPARQRTLRHMRGLLTKTVAGAVLGTAGCKWPPIVCDPLPPPVDCNALAEGHVVPWLAEAATWIGATAQAGIRVQFTFLGSDATFSGAPVADAGTVQDIAVEVGGLEFTFVPAAGATTAHLSANVQCQTGTATVGFTLDLTGTPAPGTAVPLTFDQ